MPVNTGNIANLEFLMTSRSLKIIQIQIMYY